MSKRVFQILDEMNQNDTANSTRTVALSNTLISANKVKQGGTITIGVDAESFNDVIQEKSMVILLVIDKAEYQKTK